MAQRFPTSGTVASSIVPVQPLSPPSGTLNYIEVSYGKTKSRRGRKSSMKRFKIRYTNTKGVVKTRNIKATSEDRAMSEIKDMVQHHYTIIEDDGDGDEDDREENKRIVKEIMKEEWLAKYASYLSVSSDSYSSILPMAIKVAAQTISLDLKPTEPTDKELPF